MSVTEWKRGEFENLKRKFSGAKWRLYHRRDAPGVSEAVGRVGGLIIRARWLWGWDTGNRSFEVDLETRDGDIVASHRSANRPWQAIAAMRNTFLVLVGTLLQALPEGWRDKDWKEGRRRMLSETELPFIGVGNVVVR